MPIAIRGYFDGRVIILNEPLNLPIGQPLRLHLELDGSPPPFADLLRFAADLPDAPTDMAAQHDHYLYGRAKH
jgi:hypothetical protein